MSEAVKTGIFAGVAVLVAVIAVVTKPEPIKFTEADQVGEALFPEFTDPGKAAGLEIVSFDSSLGTLHKFSVERDRNKRWTIPSHDGYPADAEEQMKDAALALVDLEVLGVASEVGDNTDVAKEHITYGVVEPNQDDIEVGEEGVGMMVTVKDTADKNLARLVVGHKVKGQDDQRFVRQPPQDIVYVVKFDTEKFSTDFENWIEKDLLKLSSFDIEDIDIKDYSVVQQVQGLQIAFGINERFSADLRYDSTDSKWLCEQYVTYDEGNPTTVDGPPEGKEVDTEKLNGVKSALDDLEIVNVRRKPAGLTADLRAGDEFLKSNEAINDLFQRGFFPLAGADDKPEIRSANGEMTVGMKSGVEYLLRFGEIAGTEKAEGSTETTANRYMFVTARVNKDKIPPPEQTPLPTLPSEQNNDEEAADVSVDAFRELQSQGVEGEDETAKEADILAEREQIEKENKRKMDEYHEKLKKAEDEVRDLNDRFADWYYVISDEMYKKIRLTEQEVFKEKEEAEDADEEAATSS